MDIVSHAVAGAAVGAYYNHPYIGAIVGAMPDLVLGFKRLEAPTRLYRFTHSVDYLALATGFGWGLLNGPGAALFFFATLSHLLLDVPTHGPLWAPRLLYPWDWHCKCFTEWEFFNGPWMFGLFILWCWCSIWAGLAK